MHFNSTILLKAHPDIASARKEYDALPDQEWRKDFFSEETGGFEATHIFKEKDDFRRSGIAAEVKACFDLAKQGKHVLRLPENIPNLIDNITINGTPYRKLLKFKPGETNPRGYPDAYFDSQTWDFKTSEYGKVKSVRKLILDGRKADNVIFILKDGSCLEMIISALDSEIGNCLKNNTLSELPNVFYIFDGKLVAIWVK